MSIVRYAVVAVLGVALVVASIGWYLSAHPGGARFQSCEWRGSELVLRYSYGTGDKVSTMVSPQHDHVVAQLRVDERDGDTSGSLDGVARYAIDGGPRPVRYPNGADLDCPTG